MQSGKTDSVSDPDSETVYPQHDTPGDPNCPLCGGIGYLRADLPINHPDFGKLQICSCRSKEISQQVHERLFSLSNLDALKHLTFENFKACGRVGLWPAEADSLELAYNQARQFSSKLDGWLLLQGGFGCGKTHLAAAIANFAVSMGVPTLFITVPDLLDLLRMSYQNKETTYEERFEQIRTAPLLILDDFGTQNATQWAQEKLFQIINYRYINRKPTVVTTNMPLNEIEERIRSRLQDPELVTRVRIKAPDYRNPTIDIGHHEKSLLALMHDLTFDNFDLRENEGITARDQKSLQAAFDAAYKFAKKPQGWLLFSGYYACGKTHLAAAIGNYLAAIGSPPQVVSVPAMLDHLRATFNPNSSATLDRRFEEYRTAPVLILDDLGTQSISPWVEEKLFQLFNYRYLAKLPTVITTSSYIDDMDLRLVSRMKDTRLCTIYAITVPGYHETSDKKGKRRKSHRSTK
jgi:DNA replication protein DnaC